jgi:hypothetical protein
MIKMLTEKLRRRIALTTIVAGLAIGMAGCHDPAPTKQLLYDSSVYAQVSETRLQALEGRIVKVQPGEISFIGYKYDLYGGRTAAGHEFEYVMVETQDGKLHTLIYPYTMAIIEKNAVINFNPISGGVIDTKTFIDNFINDDFITDDNVSINAEGIIAPNGITYK